MSNSGRFSVIIRLWIRYARRNHELSLKTISYGGKKDNFLIWIKKFKSKKQLAGRLDILTNAEWIMKTNKYEDVKKKTGSDRTIDKESIIVRCDRGMAKYSVPDWVWIPRWIQEKRLELRWTRW